MSKLITLAAAGAGYVLGARAGRERYDQLVQTYARVRNDPRVQQKAQQATDVVKEKGPVVAENVKGKVGGAADAAKDKVGGSDSSADTTEAGLNSDRLKLTDETGPQGKLP